MTKISKFFKSRTFACGRSAPRSILCAPNLLGSNQGSCFTAIVHEIPVHVRRLPTAFHHCVLYHWRHVTVHSWRRYRHVSTVSEWVGGGRHHSPLHLHRQECVHPSLYSDISWFPVLRGDTCREKVMFSSSFKCVEGYECEKMNFACMK